MAGQDILEMVCVTIICLSFIGIAINRIRYRHVERDIQRGRERIAYLDGQQAALDAIRKTRGGA